jgi:hypothetical protein
LGFLINKKAGYMWVGVGKWLELEFFSVEKIWKNCSSEWAESARHEWDHQGSNLRGLGWINVRPVGPGNTVSYPFPSSSILATLLLGIERCPGSYYSVMKGTFWAGVHESCVFTCVWFCTHTYTHKHTHSIFCLHKRLNTWRCPLKPSSPFRCNRDVNIPHLLLVTKVWVMND